MLALLPRIHSSIFYILLKCYLQKHFFLIHQVMAFSNYSIIWENRIGNSWWEYNTKKNCSQFSILSFLFNLEKEKDKSKLLGNKQLVSHVHFYVNSFMVWNIFVLLHMNLRICAGLGSEILGPMEVLGPLKMFINIWRSSTGDCFSDFLSILGPFIL